MGRGEREDVLICFAEVVVTLGVADTVDYDLAWHVADVIGVDLYISISIGSERCRMSESQ